MSALLRSFTDKDTLDYCARSVKAAVEKAATREAAMDAGEAEVRDLFEQFVWGHAEDSLYEEMLNAFTAEINDRLGICPWT